MTILKVQVMVRSVPFRGWAIRRFPSLVTGQIAYERCVEKWGAERVRLVHLHPQPKPKGLPRLAAGLWWCPYCGAGRSFRQDHHLKIRRCEICGISEKDFSVRKENDLWNL